MSTPVTLNAIATDVVGHYGHAAKSLVAACKPPPSAPWPPVAAAMPSSSSALSCHVVGGESEGA